MSATNQGLARHLDDKNTCCACVTKEARHGPVTPALEGPWGLGGHVGLLASRTVKKKFQVQ